MGVTIDEIRESGASARSFLWDMTINKHGLDPVANLRCTTGNIPSPVPQKIESIIRGYTIPEGGATEWNPLTFTCIENVDYEIMKALWEWSKSTFDWTTGVLIKEDASPDGSGGDITIMMEGLERSPQMTFELVGCILSGVTNPDPGADKAAVLEPSFEVSYAYANQS